MMKKQMLESLSNSLVIYMTTLKERFEKQFVRRFTHGEDVNTSSGELLSFFRQELLALAESCQKHGGLGEQFSQDEADAYDMARAEMIALIRSKAEELV